MSVKPYLFHVKYEEHTGHYIVLTTVFRSAMAFEHDEFAVAIHEDALHQADHVLNSHSRVQMHLQTLPSFSDDMMHSIKTFVAWHQLDGSCPGDSDTIRSLRKVCPGINAYATHPVMDMRLTVGRIVISLNDSYGWTRESIADWLESLDVDISFGGEP